jgi:hypothetical protein
VRSRKSRARSLAILVACIVTGALFTAGPAGAASHSFQIQNKSSKALKFEAVERVTGRHCFFMGICFPIALPIDFESLPGRDEPLEPHGPAQV